MTRSTSTQRGASRRTSGTTAAQRSKPRATRSAAPKTASRGRAKAVKTNPKAIRALILVAVVGLVWVLYPAMRLEYQASRHKAALERQRDAIARENDRITDEVDGLKTPEGVEREARESLGYAKRGENVYVVVPTDPITGEDPLTVEQADVNGRSIVTVLLDAIFGVSQPTTTVEP